MEEEEEESMMMGKEDDEGPLTMELPPSFDEQEQGNFDDLLMERALR